MSFRRNREVFFISHSQIVNIRHPAFRIFLALLTSLFLLAVSLGSQKLTLDLGSRASLHRE
jgi:hypothetical protein